MLRTGIVVLGGAWAALWAVYALVGGAVHLCHLPLHLDRWLHRRRRRP